MKAHVRIDIASQYCSIRRMGLLISLQLGTGGGRKRVKIIARRIECDAVEFVAIKRRPDIRVAITSDRRKQCRQLLPLDGDKFAPSKSHVVGDVGMHVDRNARSGDGRMHTIVVIRTQNANARDNAIAIQTRIFGEGIPPIVKCCTQEM